MKEYILDTFKIGMSEKEAEKYFSKEIKKMNITERKIYLKNERKYLKFFKILLKRNRKFIIKIREYFEYEISNLFKKEQKMLKKEIININKFNFKFKNMHLKNRKYLEIFLKISYRDAFGYQGMYTIYFPKDKIYINAITDYQFIIIFINNNKEEIKKIAKKCKLFIGLLQIRSNDEEDLESLGRPTNDYFKKQYSKNDKAIDLKSDGKDYSNVDFGENVGDKTIENPLELYDKKYTTADERKEVEKILSEEKGEDYLVDWELYNESLERDYRAEINYLVSQAKNRVNKLSEIEKGNFEEVPPKESVFHNFINTKEGKKVVINKSLRNTKKVDYDTGKEVVISKSNKIVKDYMNQGTSNNYTYGPDGIVRSDEGKFDKMLHGIFDIGNYISKGTGVADKTTTLERINMTILGTLVSLNYDELEKWASENNYNAIGYKEYFEYKIYKFYINSYKNSRRNMYK